MKVIVNINCTPAEARQFLGLPDVEPMQKAAMAEIEKRMMTELERFSPEHMFQVWMPMAKLSPEWFQEMLRQFQEVKPVKQ